MLANAVHAAVLEAVAPTLEPPQVMTTQNNDDAVARGDGPHPYMQKKG